MKDPAVVMGLHESLLLGVPILVRSGRYGLLS